MTDCVINREPFFCPTKWPLWRQVLALLPSGRAWQNYEDMVTSNSDVEPVVEKLTVMQQYWASFAEVLEYLHQQACTLLSEMFCSTVSETLTEWLIDLGMPGECEAYDNICEKLIDPGGARCEDLVAAAARRGWVIDCRDCNGVATARADAAYADCASECICPNGALWITIYTADSPAYVAPEKPRLRARCGRARCNRLCNPDTSALECIIDKIRHAHLKITYEVV